MGNLKKYLVMTLVFMCTFIIGSGFAKAASVTYYLDTPENAKSTNLKLDDSTIIGDKKFKTLETAVNDSISNKSEAQRRIAEYNNKGYEFDGWSVTVSGKTGTIYTNSDKLTDVSSSSYNAYSHWNKVRSIVTVNGTKITAANQRVEVKSGTTKQGTVKVTSTYPVATNSALSINIVPEEGYEIDEISYTVTDKEKVTVKGDNEAIKENEVAGYDYIIPGTEMTDDISIEVSFKLKTFSLTFEGNSVLKGIVYSTISDFETGIARTGPKIGIYHITSNLVNYGDDAVLTITPYKSNGYRIKYVKVDGKSIDLKTLTEKPGEPGEEDNIYEYKFENIKSDIDISIKFEKITYNVTTKVEGGHGTISSGGTVGHGEDFEVTFTPENGYMVSMVTVNGSPVTVSGNKLTLTEVKGDKDVVVKYTKIPVTLYIDCSDNAIVDPSGDASGSIDLFYGDNQTFTIKAKDGYILSSVLVDGNEKLPIENDTLVLENITKDMTVKVVVEKETYEVLNGMDQVITRDEDLIVRFSGGLNKFAKLLVDDKEVDEKNYTKEEGSTIITLSKKYLSTLKRGKHKIAAVYANGNSAATNFTIEENPKTGDNLMTYIIVGIVSLIGIAGAGLYIKKRNVK